MKKSLISFVAAAALIGFAGIANVAQAGTVTTTGDTNISISGFIAEYFGFVNNQAGLFSAAASNPGMKNGSGTYGAQTNFSSTSNVTRLRMNLNNPTEGIIGEVSGDFRGVPGKSGGGDDGATSTFRLRQAWFEKLFCQEGCNYTPWLLIGQTKTLGMPGSYSFLSLVYAGVAGSGTNSPPRVPQVAFGVKFNLGSAKLNPEIAVMDLQNEVPYKNGFITGGTTAVGTPYYGFVGNSKNKDLVNATRTSVPGLGIKVPIEFNTGLGAPAKFYVDGQMQTIKVNYYNNDKNLSSNNNKTSWMVGGGLALPIYFITLKGDMAYFRGFTNMNVIFGDDYGQSGFPQTPPSYWVDSNGSLQQTHSTQWDLEAQLNLNKLAQIPVKLAGGYSQVVFSNLPFANNINNTQWAQKPGPNALNYAAAPVRKASTIFANVSYNMTKSTMLGIEYDRDKTYYTVNPNTPFNSNAVYLVGVYNF